ncbi:NAD(P)H-dependent flavin oxidoreductase [Phreatobacter stygius]|uniref:Nitronate monooxygenase n=1 Tax=Phreatobacter stygius TaxID=1940610 RepID=A0A4D7B176_9HYPH|nr:nitronate monooxygenase [Phreatobacter stygius]QCI66531.1 nitronate monooxygenase [Phreatobacter stygius]
MAIVTPLTEKFGLAVPLLLAPMAGVSGGALAAAVTNAGGLGFIGGGYCDRDWLKREMEAAGNTPVGIGFITWALEKDPTLLAAVLTRRPPAIFLSFGSIGGFAGRIKAAGIALVVQIQSVAEARLAAAEGADVIVAQGTEAGGHGGSRATLPLVPAVVDAVGAIPVVAAGGIGDGRGLAAALMLGASGALCGTAFFASRESLAHANAKQAAVAGSGDETIRGSLFDLARGIDWPEPWTMRTLANGFSRQWQADLAGLRTNLGPEQARYGQARDQGNVDVAAVIVGEGVDMVRAVEPAEAIVRRIGADAERLLDRAASHLSR